MCPSRFVLPSNPLYSAAARASRSVTSGDPSDARTSPVVSRMRFGPRSDSVVGGGETWAFEIGRPSADQAGKPPSRIRTDSRP